MSKATIYPIVPEVCQFCSTGLAWMVCYDGKYRCRVCVHRYAEKAGWTEIPGKLIPQVKVTPIKEIIDEHIEPDETYLQPKML